MRGGSLISRIPGKYCSPVDVIQPYLTSVLVLSRSVYALYGLNALGCAHTHLVLLNWLELVSSQCGAALSREISSQHVASPSQVTKV